MSESVRERDRWQTGIVRHLQLDPYCSPENIYAVRQKHDGGIERGGSEDIVYTLVVHPKHADRVEEFRQRLERSPELGGVFSPERDIR